MTSSSFVGARAFACAMAVTFAAACGGGGGGGTASLDGAESTVPMPRKAFFDAPTPGMSVVLTFGGDLEWLYQQDLYIFVVYPEPVVFGDEIALDVGPDPATQLWVGIPGVRELPVGTYTGELEIHACLDEYCARELENSPRTVPYTVEILGGLAFTPSSLTVSAPFGAHETRRVAASLPETATSLQIVTWDTIYGFRAEQPADHSANLDVTFPVQPPGHYEHTFQVMTSARDPSTNYQTGRDFYASLELAYDVEPNPGVPIALTGTRATHRAASGSCTAMPQPQGVYLVRQDPSDVANVPVTTLYDEWPAAADGNPGRTAWLTSGEYYTVDPCPGDWHERLPPGTYVARMRHTHPNGGTPYSADFTVELVVEP